MTDPKGTWSDGGKVWEGEPTPAVGGEASERLDVIASWLMGEAFCADWHDDPDMGVRECMRIKALFIDRINEFVCDEIKRAQPASTLRGGELLDAAQKVVMRYPYVTEKEALEIAKAVLALAQPAPPLRGRELDRDVIAQAIYETEMEEDNEAATWAYAKMIAKTWKGRGPDFDRHADIYQRTVDDQLTQADSVIAALSASPPEQPAAAPSVAARMSILNDGPPGVVGKVDPSRSGPLTRPAADPVTRREETITKCLKIIGIHEFSARQGVRSAMGPKVRKQALAAEAALQAVAKDIRALSTAQDKRGPSTSGSPVFSGGTSDDLDIEPIEGAKP